MEALGESGYASDLHGNRHGGVITKLAVYSRWVPVPCLPSGPSALLTEFPSEFSGISPGRKSAGSGLRPRKCGKDPFTPLRQGMR
jgi:hypothetical protein